MPMVLEIHRFLDLYTLNLFQAWVSGPWASKMEGDHGTELSQEKARVLFEQGAMFLLLDFPEGSEFGIDNNSWNVGRNFRGIKMIPPGIHFVFFSAVSKEKQTAPRSGFFYNFSPKEILVRKWNKQLEEMEIPKLTEDDNQRFQENKKEMDRFLGAYPYERYKQWVSLSNQLNNECLDILQPDCGIVHSVAQFESEGSTTQSRQAAAAEEAMAVDIDDTTSEPLTDGLPNLKSVIGSTIKYSAIPKRKYPLGSTPAEISKYNMDSSYALTVLLEERFGKDILCLLGEVQYAFISFLIGQNYDSFEQWKRLVHLLCTSGDQMVKQPEAFLAFISILHFQIREIPSDFFVDIVSSNNFLTVTLHEFFQNLLNEDVSSELRKKGLSFKKHLTEKFKWDFTSEPDDYAPVVVDL